MIAGRFFHKYKRPAEWLTAPEKAEPYRQHHRENFRGLSGFLEELAQNPVCTSAGARLRMNPARTTACLQFAEWMAGAAPPAGNEVESSQALGSLCESLDILAQSGQADLHWKNIDLACFDNPEATGSLHPLKLIYCRHLALAQALARVLTHITGAPYACTRECRTVRAALKAQGSIIWIQTGQADKTSEASFFALFAKNGASQITAFPAPISLPDVLTNLTC